MESKKRRSLVEEKGKERKKQEWQFTDRCWVERRKG